MTRNNAYTPRTCPMLFSAAFSAALAFYAWRHRTGPGAAAFAVYRLLLPLWTLFTALGMAAAWSTKTRSRQAECSPLSTRAVSLRPARGCSSDSDGDTETKKEVRMMPGHRGGKTQREGDMERGRRREAEAFYASPRQRIPPSPCLRVLLADDHGLFVEGLQNLLQAGGYQVVGAARDGLEALQLARKLRPDVILMDVRMPDCDGLTATRLIQAELPEIKIVMLTTSTEDEDLFEAIKSGASGYLLKNLEPNQLFDYLAGLSRGEAPLSRELSARLLQEFAHQAADLDQRDASGLRGGPPGPDLTPRQREILALVATGQSYKEVAAILSLSEHTVKYHMGQILERLHLKNRAQVIAYALRSGLGREG